MCKPTENFVEETVAQPSSLIQGVEPTLFRVGSVPYVNARPLVSTLESPDSGVSVEYAVPSRLPALLDSGAADAILVSSIEFLRRPNMAICGHVGIVSKYRVCSVRLFSKVPFAKIKTLALDRASMTSNVLGQILLKEKYNVVPQTTICDSDQRAMLADHDACILIGDLGMDAASQGLHVMDLGQDWTDLTGHPFVWAVWLSRNDPKLAPLARLLEQAPVETGFVRPRASACSLTASGGQGRCRGVVELRGASLRRSLLIEETSRRTSWPISKVERYLERVMSYELGSSEMAGLKAYADLAYRNGFLEATASEFPVL